LDIGLTPTTEEILHWGVKENSLLFLGSNAVAIVVALVLVPVSEKFGDFLPNIFGLCMLCITTCVLDYNT
jgi:hypothetical protein